MKETEKIEIMHFDQEGYLEDGKALYETGKKMTALADKVADEGYEACLRGETIRVPGTLNRAATLASRATPKWLVRRVAGALARRVE